MPPIASTLIRRLAPVLASALVLAALGCREDVESPTAPGEPGGPAFDHTSGHKVVNSLADPGNGVCNATQCTLREAIQDPQSTEISFKPGLTGTITLARPGLGGGTLVIEKTLTITGPSAGIVILRRSTDPDFRIFRIGSGATVRLTNLTIRNGKADPGGGGILSYATLVLTNCNVVANSASGIRNHGHLTVRNSRVARNIGLGIDNFPNATLTLANTEVTANTGNGIGNRDDVRLTVTNSVISHNEGTGIRDLGGRLKISHSKIRFNRGGGIGQHRGSATLENVRIIGNSTPGNGGGIALSNTQMAVVNSTIMDNSAVEGGGIFNWFKGNLTLTNSTVWNNAAQERGGGIRSQARPRGGVRVTLTNSTVSGNSAAFGAGIFSADDGEASASILLVNSTVAFNTATQGAGGIAQSGIEDAFLSLTNSLVARNRAPAAPDIAGPDNEAERISASFSLIGDGSGTGITNDNGNQVGTASAPIDPKLGPLADNGGPTRTHALLLGSPAIDAASTPDCPLTDQRGVLRPQGAACDIGSYERQ
jgi:CSLREA domain-containing protein